QRKLFNDGDMTVQFGKFLWSMNEDNLAKAVAEKLRPGDDPWEKEFAEMFAKSLPEVENAVVGFHLKDGVDGHMLVVVPKEGNAAKLLARLRKKQQPSTLAGLPDGNVLFAQASSGAGEQALLAKSLFNFMLEDLLIKDKLVTHVDRLKYLGIFHEVWSRLDGSRLAIYQNEDETKRG